MVKINLSSLSPLSIKSSVFILLCFFMVNVNAAKASLKFNEINIASPIKLIHPVMIANILPAKGKELITLGIDTDNQRWLYLYSIDEDKSNVQVIDRIKIPQQVFSFDISEAVSDNVNKAKSNQQQLQHLYFMTSEQLLAYQPNQDNQPGKFETILKISSIYLEDKPQFISQGDFIFDLNQDGIDDFVIADFSKVHLAIGQADGQMLKQTLPIKAEVNLQVNGASYNQRKFYLEDTNFDGNNDIILVGSGELTIYQQDTDAQFSSREETLVIKSSIHGAEWWSQQDETGGRLDQSDLVYRKLESLQDMNNDGVLDMVVRFTQSSGMLDRVNDYEIYLGQNKNNKLVFSEQAHSVIHTDGTLTGVRFVDINNDKKLEVVLAGFDIGLSQIIGALLSGSIDQDVYVFKMDQYAKFDKKPNVSKEVDLNFSLSSGQSGSPVVKLADINGDGLKDLLLSDSDEKFKVYYGESGEKLFSRRSTSYKTILPKEGENLLIDDLNGDGKDDLLIKFSKQDDEKLRQTIRILLAS